jgi:neutral ceramidase
MAGKTFRAGVGRVVITPPLTAPHASWGAQVHVLPDGVEADLWATALVADDGVAVVAWIDLDLVIVTRQESDAIREAVATALDIPPQAVRVSVTHNHAGPPPSAWNWTRQGQEALDGYYALLPEYAAGAARIARNRLRPARVAAGSGESRVAVNRREIAPNGRPVTGVNPEGPIDPQVFVLRIDDRDGAPLAAVVGYTMHPTTLGPSNRLISPDWPGHLKRTVEAFTGATCLFAQGATGNIGPGPDGFTDDVSVVRRLGRQVGCEAARVYVGLQLPAVRHRHERVWESGAPLGKWVSEPVPEPEPVVRVMSREVMLPLGEQPSMSDTQALVDEAQRRLDDLKQRAAPATEIEAATFATKRANMALSRALTYGGREAFPVDLHLLQIGPAVLVGTEGEPFAELGLEIKARSPWPATWFGGYTGGWAGYIPAADAYPRRGYEVETSPFAPEAASRLVAETLAALTELQMQGQERGQMEGDLSRSRVAKAGSPR